MAKEKLAAARTLINQKRFSEARAILETIDDNPAAQKLLAQLNRKSPRKSSRGGGGLVGYLLTILISALLTSGLLAAVVVATAPNRPSGGPATTALPATMIAGGEPTLMPSPLPTVLVGMVQSNQNVNLRSGPGTTFNLIGTVSPGTSVTVLAASDDEQWYNVRLDDGTEGWMFSNLLDTEPATVTPVEVVTGEATEEAAATIAATAEPTCTPEEARAWWNEHPLYAQASYVILAAQESETPDYDLLFNTVDAAWTRFREAERPACAESVYQNVLSGMDLTWQALQSYENRDSTTGAARMDSAREQFFAPALARMADLGAEITATDCGAEFWYAILQPRLEDFAAFTDGLDVNAAGADNIRTGVFRLQEVRRDFEAFYAPLCATNARDSLLNAVDRAVDLYRAIFDGNTALIQDALTGVSQQTANFYQELSRLGVALD